MIKIAEQGLNVYSRTALRSMFGPDYKNLGINEFIISRLKKFYKIKSTSELLESRKHRVSEARMFCFFLLHEFSNPVLSRQKIAGIYRTVPSAVHDKIIQFNSYLKNPKFNQVLLTNYAIFKEEVADYVKWLNGQDDTPPEKKPVDPDIQRLLDEIELPTQINIMENTEIIDEENHDHLPIPDVDDTPLKEELIDRNIGKALSNALNESNAVQDAVEIKEEKKETQKPPIRPSFSSEEAKEDFPEEEAHEDNEEDDVPPMQYDIPPNPGSGGYAIPPEAKEWANNFSSKSIIDMVNLILPRTVSEFCQVDENKIHKVLADAERSVKDKAVKEVRSMNRDHEQELTKKVREITPFMEGPLKETLAIHDLTLSPATVLVVLCAWMGVTLFLTSRKMSQRCSNLVADLEAMMERKKANDIASSLPKEEDHIRAAA